MLDRDARVELRSRDRLARRAALGEALEQNVRQRVGGVCVAARRATLEQNLQTGRHERRRVRRRAVQRLRHLASELVELPALRLEREHGRHRERRVERDLQSLLFILFVALFHPRRRRRVRRRGPMRFPLTRRRSRRRRARRDGTPRRGRSLQGPRGSSVARVGGTHRAAVGRSKRPSGAHVVGARGEMPGRDASRGERVRETREERDGASVRGGSVRAARRAHGTSPRGGVWEARSDGLFKLDFLVSVLIAAVGRS